jgi:hypothetical protein
MRSIFVGHRRTWPLVALSLAIAGCEDAPTRPVVTTSVTLRDNERDPETN